VITHSGGGFVPSEKMAHDFTLEDIAHHLSMVNRWGGATTRYYSVLDHCLIMYKLLDIDSPVHLRLGVLLHDAHEFILHDIPSTWKNVGIADFGRVYKDLIDYVQDRIERRLGVGDCPSSYKRLGKDVGYYDKLMLFVEAECFLTLKAQKEFELVYADWIRQYNGDVDQLLIKKGKRITRRHMLVKRFIGNWFLRRRFILCVKQEIKYQWPKMHPLKIEIGPLRG